MSIAPSFHPSPSCVVSFASRNVPSLIVRPHVRTNNNIKHGRHAIHSCHPGNRQPTLHCRHSTMQPRSPTLRDITPPRQREGQSNDIRAGRREGPFPQAYPIGKISASSKERNNRRTCTHADVCVLLCVLPRVAIHGRPCPNNGPPSSPSGQRRYLSRSCARHSVARRVLLALLHICSCYVAWRASTLLLLLLTSQLAVEQRPSDEERRLAGLPPRKRGGTGRGRRHRP